MPNRVTSAEFARLSSLYRYGVLDSEAEPAIDQALSRLASRLNVSAAQLVFADAQRFWAKSTVGSLEPVVPRGCGLLEELITAGPAFVAEMDRTEGMPAGTTGMRSFAGLRLAAIDDEAIGILFVADPRPRDFAIEAAEALATTVTEVRAVLDSDRRAREDEGTGALRHDAFLDQARRLVDVSRASRQWISLVTLDLTSFRSVMDARVPGLSALVIRQMAGLGRMQVRRRDSFGRLGPDLFAVLLTDTGEAGARVLAQRLGRHLERGWIAAGLGGTGLKFGVASMRPSTTGDTVTMLMERATAGTVAKGDARSDARVA